MRSPINCLFARWGRQPRADTSDRQILMYSHIHSGFARAASYPAHKNPAFLGTHNV